MYIYQILGYRDFFLQPLEGTFFIFNFFYKKAGLYDIIFF